jgi:hypothetical protein
MNDKKFIELLNLYVDREVSAEDALLLEAEVATNPRRRKVYDQYCRMQKACSMLSSELSGKAADMDRRLLAFPSPSVWRSVPLMVTLAAAACIVAVIDVRQKSAASLRVAEAAQAPRSLASTVDLPAPRAAMEPVYLAKLSASQPAQGFTVLDTSAQDGQLSWIAGIHMTPVFPSANPDYISDPKAALNAAGPGVLQGAAAQQEPVEMTAFRFQR